MKKKEFMLELEIKLKGIDSLERQNILNYYDELISDKIDEGLEEERVVRNLGTFDEIMHKLNINPDEHKNKIKYDSVIEDEIRKEEKRKTKIDAEVVDNTENIKNKKEEKPVNKDSSRTALIAILIIIFFPLWFTLLMTAIGLVIGAASALVGFMAAGVGIIIGGIATIIAAFAMFTTSVPTALFTLGGGIILIGVGCILTPITIKIGVFIIKQAAKGIKFICKLVFKGGK